MKFCRKHGKKQKTVENLIVFEKYVVPKIKQNHHRSPHGHFNQNNQGISYS